jgi:serine/threonine protein kinase
MVDHPNLCKLDDSFLTEGRIFFVCPLFPGGELKTHLDRQEGNQFYETEAKFFVA